MADEAKPLALQPEVAAKYDLKGAAPGISHFPGFGEIDLTKLDVKKADRLVTRGFSWLVAKPAPAAKPSAPATDTSKNTTTTQP